MKQLAKVVLIISLLTSCQKYEEGPLISLSSVSGRLEGYYIVDFVTEDGIDQMDRYNSLHITSYFIGTGLNQQQEPNSFAVEISDSFSYPSFWILYNDDQNLILGTFGCSGFIPPFQPVSFAPVPGFMTDDSCSVFPIWTIVKLTQKKLWLTTTFKDKYYEVRLKEKKQ